MNDVTLNRQFTDYLLSGDKDPANIRKKTYLRDYLAKGYLELPTALLRQEFQPDYISRIQFSNIDELRIELLSYVIAVSHHANTSVDLSNLPPRERVEKPKGKLYILAQNGTLALAQLISNINSFHNIKYKDYQEPDFVLREITLSNVINILCTVVEELLEGKDIHLDITEPTNHEESEINIDQKNILNLLDSYAQWIYTGNFNSGPINTLRLLFEPLIKCLDNNQNNKHIAFLKTSHSDFEILSNSQLISKLDYYQIGIIHDTEIDENQTNAIRRHKLVAKGDKLPHPNYLINCEPNTSILPVAIHVNKMGKDDNFSDLKTALDLCLLIAQKYASKTLNLLIGLSGLSNPANHPEISENEIITITKHLDSIIPYELKHTIVLGQIETLNGESLSTLNDFNKLEPIMKLLDRVNKQGIQNFRAQFSPINIASNYDPFIINNYVLALSKQNVAVIRFLPVIEDLLEAPKPINYNFLGLTEEKTQRHSYAIGKFSMHVDISFQIEKGITLITINADEKIFPKQYKTIIKLVNLSLILGASKQPISIIQILEEFEDKLKPHMEKYDSRSSLGLVADALTKTALSYSLIG